MNIAEFLQQQIEAGLTRSRLAQRIGVHQSYISRWLNGEVPGPRLCRQIADALDIQRSTVLAMAGHYQGETLEDEQQSHRDIEKEMVLRELEAILDQTPRNHWQVLARVTRATSEALPGDQDRRQDPEEHQGNEDGRDNVNKQALAYDSLSQLLATAHTHSSLSRVGA